MTGRDGRTLEPSDDHFLQRIPLVVRVHWRNLPRWGDVRADSARDHVHCMRPLRATTVARLGGSNGRRDGVVERMRQCDMLASLGVGATGFLGVDDEPPHLI